MGRGEFVPRIGAALLHAQRDAAALLVDVEHHDFAFIAQLHQLGRVDVFVGPVHFGDMDQAFDALFQLHEATVIGEIGDLAEQAGACRVTAGDVEPRILAQLFEAQGNTVLFLVVLEHLDLELLPDLDGFGRVAHALPGHVGNVQQAVNTPEINEGAVIGKILDHARNDRTFLEILQQGFLLGAVFGFHDRAAGQHDVIALLIDLDDLEFQIAAFQVSGVSHGAHVHEGTRQEGAQGADGHGEAAAHLAGQASHHGFVLFVGHFQVGPGLEPLCLVAGQQGGAQTVFQQLQGAFDDIAYVDLDLTIGVQELPFGHDTLGFQPGVDHHDVGTDVDNGPLDDTARTHFSLGQTLFEQFSKALAHKNFCMHAVPWGTE